MKRLLILTVTLLSSALFAPGGSFGAEFCVSNAVDLQAALTASQSNGENDIIRVVQGTYTGQFTYYSSENKSITLMGGYTSGCSERVLNPTNTILDGENIGTVLTLENYNGGGGASLEGFTLQNGDADNDGGGAYVYTYSNSFPVGAITVSNNIINGNTAKYGGGIYAQNSSDSQTVGTITFSGNTIQNNIAYDFGGGVYVSNYANAPSNSGGNVVFTNNTISNNTSYESSGGVYIGTTTQTQGRGKVTFTGNTISSNLAYDAYGAGYMYTYNKSTGKAGDITFNSNAISLNTAYSNCGGVYFSTSNETGTGGTIALSLNSFLDNISYDRGGGSTHQR